MQNFRTHIWNWYIKINLEISLMLHSWVIRYIMPCQHVNRSALIESLMPAVGDQIYISGELDPWCYFNG